MLCVSLSLSKLELQSHCGNALQSEFRTNLQLHLLLGKLSTVEYLFEDQTDQEGGGC